MSIPAQEAIVYEGEEFNLFEYPLEPFLEQNKQIKFGLYTNVHMYRYQGYWLLKAGKLYLTKIESANYTMTKIFGSKKRVFANWYTGDLEFGFGEWRANGWRGYYENYHVFTIEQGLVKDHKIIQRPELENF